MNKFLKNKSDIIAWLDQYNIKNYKLIMDDKYGYAVDVSGNVNLFDKSLNHIPVKFGNVSGSFDCGCNKLISLEFCPQTVGGNFYCSDNKLSSLEFCPTTIDGDFYCNNNKIANLINFPDHIGGGIYLKNNELTEEIIKINKYYNFKEIYPIHLEHKIVAEKEILDNSINKTLEFSSKRALNYKSNRLKI